MMLEQNQDWFEEELESSEGDGVVEYDITTSPRDLTPASIAEMINSGIIEIPMFQRKFVWGIDKASKLVESLILGLPVPELFFYSEGDENTTYKVIDGQQRLLSIYFFVMGKFPKDNARLQIQSRIKTASGLEDILQNNDLFMDFCLQLSNNKKSTREKASRYDKEKFGTLDKDTQIKFRLRRFLRTVVVRQNKPDDNSSSMFEIFNRLNTGGEKLNPQEVRASLYYCQFYDMLITLNENIEWRSILGKPSQDLRSNDVELLLRSFALLFDLDSYAPKLVDFLNKFSQKSKKFDAEKCTYLEELFLSFIESCSELPERAFFLRKFSKTLFESVFVAVCHSCISNNSLVTKKITPESFDILKRDDMFLSYLQSGSYSSENMNSRITRAKELIRFKEN